MRLPADRTTIAGRDRLATATAMATGTEGPVRAALERLRRYGLGERVLKSGLAAGLAWLIAERIHPDPVPVLAPLTAFFTIQSTLAQSFRGSAQRLLGVGAGIAMALILTRLLGLEWWSVAIVAMACLIAAFRLLGLEAPGVEQMTVSALLVMITGSRGDIVDVAGYHALDTIIGTAIGLATNALIAPPSHVGPAREAVRTLGADLARLLRELAETLQTGISSTEANELLKRSRELAADFDAVQLALERADEGLRYNLSGRRQHRAIIRIRRLARALEHAAIQVRVICRAVSDASRSLGAHDGAGYWLAPGVLGISLAEHLRALARLLDYATEIGDPQSPERLGHYPLASTQQARAALINALSAHAAAFVPDGWILAGEIVSLSDQMVADLRQAIAELGA